MRNFSHKFIKVKKHLAYEISQRKFDRIKGAYIVISKLLPMLDEYCFNCFLKEPCDPSS